MNRLEKTVLIAGYAAIGWGLWAMPSFAADAENEVAICTVESGYAVHVISIYFDHEKRAAGHEFSEIIDGEAANYTCNDAFNYCTRVVDGWKGNATVGINFDIEAETYVERYMPHDPDAGPGWVEQWPMSCEVRGENVNAYRFKESG